MIAWQVVFTIAIFIITVTFIIWRPYRLNESLPTAAGALLLFTAGIVSLMDIYQIISIVSGPVITILSTIIMSIVLESIGFFRFIAHNLVIRANGSGVRLFWLINLLCFLMTMFFNNDGSILITTPIIIDTLNMLKLKPLQKIPYLLSGALIATASSAPIGVSNLANLISLKIVGLDLISYTTYLFLPAMFGITIIALMLFAIYRNIIPKKVKIDEDFTGSIHSSQLHDRLLAEDIVKTSFDWKLIRICLTIVVTTRISLFIVSPFGIPLEIPSIIGAMLLIAVRRYFTGTGALDVVRRTPWHILIFAFSMYVLAYGLIRVGLSDVIHNELGALIVHHHFYAIFIMGLLMTIMSNILNNLPSVMIATLSLTNMDLDLSVLQLSYMASVIGADIGSLILPMGTLATLLWMYILRQHQIPFSWWQYTKIAVIVIPVGLLVSLASLFLWSEFLMYMND